MMPPIFTRGLRSLLCDEQIVMDAHTLARPVEQHASAVGAFGMVAAQEPFGDHRPLDGNVARIVDGEVLVDAPADRDMVDHDVAGASRIWSTSLLAAEIGASRTAPQANMAQDDVVAI